MPKLTPARLDGVYGMRQFTADELHQHADRLELQVADPRNTDDPKWLRRWANRIRQLARRKEVSGEHKRTQRK